MNEPRPSHTHFEQGPVARLCRLTKLVLALSFACVIASATTAMAQTLWGNAVHGMSVAAALEAIEGSRPVSPDTTSTLGSGALERLSVPGLRVAGHDLTARLFFLDDELETVWLDAAVGRGDIATLDRIYESLLTGLRARYGAETSSARATGMFPTRRTTWIVDDVSIVLFHGYDAVRIVYRRAEGIDVL